MAKTVNYTPEQAEMMKARYVEVADQPEADRDAVVAELAAELGKNPRSIRAKLSNMGVYVAKTPVAKDGEPAVRKDELAETLAEVSGIPLTSADKLTKVDLKALIAVIRELRDGQTDEDSDEADAS